MKDYQYRWCIVKSCTVRDGPDGKPSGKLYFGQGMTIMDSEPENGRIRVLYVPRKHTGRKGKAVHGWVPVSAISSEPVVDYAGLPYRNRMGKRLPTALKPGGDVHGYIPVDDVVAVHAVTGQWALTGKGWTRFEWLEKQMIQFDYDEISAISLAVLAREVDDYRNAIRKLKYNKKLDPDGFDALMRQVTDVIGWFMDGGYARMFDSVPGSERLKDLNEELGIDNKWLLEKDRIWSELKKRNKIRKKK